MRSLLSLMLMVCGVASAIAASEPVAKVTSSAPFELRGVRVPTAGVPSWALAAGDELTTLAGPAVITFADQSRITLDSNTRIRLEGNAKAPVMRLLGGSLQYKISPASRLSVMSLNERVVPPENREGSISARRDPPDKNAKRKGPPHDPPGPPPDNPPRSPHK